MPGREDQDFIIVGGFLHLVDIRHGRGDPENSLKVRNLSFLSGWFFPAQGSVFRLCGGKASGDDPCLLQYQGVELR